MGVNRKHPLFFMIVATSRIMNRKHGYGRTKCVVRFHRQNTSHVILRMRNANFTVKFWDPLVF